MENEANVTSNTEEMAPISRAEYEALKKENNDLREETQRLETKTQVLENKTQILENKTRILENKTRALENKNQVLEDKLLESDRKLAAAYLKNAQLIEQILLAKKKLYGRSSEETMAVIGEQLSFFFNEAEAWDAESVEPSPTKVGGYTRKKHSGSIADVIPEGLEQHVVEHFLSEAEQNCTACGSKMVIIGSEDHHSLEIIPAKYIDRIDRYYTYACKVCEKETDRTVIVKTPKEPMFLPGSFASPEAVAHIMVQKYMMYSPLYRQEQEMNRVGLKLSRQTMSNWVLRASDLWLKPIYDELHKRLVRETVLHADETTVQVLQEPGKDASSKSYMWLYRTGGDTEYPIVLYDYRPNRKPENAKEFLQGFAGWVHTDGYQGYHTLPEQKRIVGCFAHARRKFDEALNVLPKEDREGSAAAIGIAYCDRLFYLEKQFSGLTVKERYLKRQEQSKPVLDELLAWASVQKQKAAPKSALGKALHYLLDQWQYLIRYLEDGRLEISNNRAERSIKPFVMGRKNWLFCKTPAGAQSSAVIYSIVETAKELDLDPYAYLLWVFQRAPKLASADADWAEKLLPEHMKMEV